MSENPYAPPQAFPELIEPEIPHMPVYLASRWARLGAVIIDGIILGIAGIGIAFALSVVSTNFNLNSIFDRFFWADTDGKSFLTSLISTALDIAFYLTINAYFLIKSGQTIGKKALGIQVVSRDNHQLLSPGKIIGIRYILVQIGYIIPGIGGLFALADALSIFTAEKRCLHDYMTGSIVIHRRPTLRSI